VIEDFTRDLDDFFAFRWSGDPYDLYRRLRNAAPTHNHRGGVVVTRYEDVKAVYQDSDTFVNLPQGVGIGGTHLPRYERLMARLSGVERESLLEIMRYERPTLVRTSAEEHKRLRGAVQRSFTPRRVKALESQIQAIADELLDEADQRTPIDFINAFAYRLPLYVVLGLMGVPRSDEEMVHRWAVTIGANKGGVVADAIIPARDAFREFLAYLTERIANFRAGEGENLLGTLLDHEKEDRLTRDEITANVINVLNGGHETTTHLLGNGLFSILKQPKQWNLLCGDPSLAEKVVDEVVRYEPSVQYMTRVAAVHTQIADADVPAGCEVFLMTASANRDERHFADADLFDIAREDGTDHLGFGFGVHRCIGAFLAKLEGTIAFATLARRFPEIQLADENPEWRANRRMRGLTQLPVILTP
jgi:cytochrome P450